VAWTSAGDRLCLWWGKINDRDWTSPLKEFINKEIPAKGSTSSLGRRLMLLYEDDIVALDYRGDRG